jgi:putative ABC transport system permease protein
MSRARPPRLACRLLNRFVPADARDTVLGDLEEVYARRLAERGRLRADAWYALEAASFSARFAWERLRELKGFATPSLLDFRLGARMLRKSPLLTVTGCAAIATAIGINAGFNEFTGDLLGEARWADVDDRVVGLANFDTESGDRDARVLADLRRWREGLETVEGIGAALRMDMSLVAPDGSTAPVEVAEMSASGFAMVEATPALGRLFLPSDDGPAAEPVAVLAHEAWARYLGANPGIVGSVIRLGDTSYTVVGVAAAETHFPGPVDVWVNFRRDDATAASRAGPPLLAFGRLAPDRSLQEAQLEMEQLGARLAQDLPGLYGRVRPAVLPYREVASGNPEMIRWALRIARTVLVLLLLVACANVATLVFARNAGRTSEIAVRSALGARRGRIVAQLFAEALVLAWLSAGVGLLAADRMLKWGGDIFWDAQRIPPPFWWDPGMSLRTIVYSLALATLGAAVVGILPALRATGRRLAATLQTAGSGGSALAFGRLPTFVIVFQIAVSVALFPIVFTMAVQTYRDQVVVTEFPTERYLTARILVDSNVELTSAAADQSAGEELRRVSVSGVTDGFMMGPTLLERYAAMRDDVARRVRNEPGVRSASLTTRLPGIIAESIPAMRLEVAGEEPPPSGWRARTATAELDFFRVVAPRVRSGRTLTQVDFAEDQRMAMVNEAFVTEVLGGEDAVGRQIRGFSPEGDPGRPWTEIVGVVPDELTGAAGADPQVYFPLSGAGTYPIRLLIEVDGDPETLAPRLQAIAAEAEPGVILDEILPLADLRRNEVLQVHFRVGIIGFVALVTALLATAGVYALLSFIVSQRTREIGIRTALGAAPGRVVRGVFLKTFVQLGLGVAIGLVVVGVVGVPGAADGTDLRTLWLTGAGVSSVLLIVGLLGGLMPVRRALSIQPSEALRADG